MKGQHVSMSSEATAACEQCKGSFERTDLVYCPAGELLCAACLSRHACPGAALSETTKRRRLGRVILASVGFAAGGSGALIVAGVQTWIALFAVGTVLFAVGAITWQATVRGRIQPYPVEVRSSVFLSALGLALVFVPAELKSCGASGGSRPSPSVRMP
jgi:hypothetical protein